MVAWTICIWNALICIHVLSGGLDLMTLSNYMILRFYDSMILFFSWCKIWVVSQHASLLLIITKRVWVLDILVSCKENYSFYLGISICNQGALLTNLSILSNRNILYCIIIDSECLFCLWFWINMPQSIAILPLACESMGN